MAIKTSTEKAAKASRENGKLGGRPKGYAAKAAEDTRAWAAASLLKEFPAIWKKALSQAKAGDKAARDYVTEFPFGKPVQPISGPNGDPLFQPKPADRELARKALVDMGEAFERAQRA